MLKMDMKKMLDNLYILSKLGFSFILLFCLLGVLYVFYLNYKKEELISQEDTLLSKKLQSNINKNTNIINNLSNEIKNNQTTLLKIEESIKNISNINNNEYISEIEKNIENLNNNLNLLTNKFDNLKSTQVLAKTISDENIIDTSKNIDELVDLILIKYENNISFDRELQYLKKNASLDKINNFEKIFLLMKKPYKGHNYLENVYDKEVSIYLKSKINKDPDSIFSKIVLPYLTVSPSTENLVTDDLIINIKKIKTNIQNGNFEIAFDYLIKIDNFENNFEVSYLELSKYLDFKMELLKIK